MKNFILYILSLFTLLLPAKSDVIIKNLTQESDTIFLGVVKYNYFIETKFEIINNDDINYKIDKGNPSLFLTNPLYLSNNDFEEFSISSPMPIEIKAKSSQNFTIRYTPKENLNAYPLGNKTALLKIGIYRADAISMPNKKEDMAYYKEYILKARKINQDLAFLESVIQIDSVYVNPVNPVKLKLTLQSSTLEHLTILNEEIFYKSKNLLSGEFYSKTNDLNKDFKSLYETKIREFEYFPLNRGWDTVDYRVVYKNNSSDYIDTAIFKFIAFGAEQHIIAQEAIDAEVANDTIYVNDVSVGSSTNFKLIISNEGNLPFGISAQSILKEYINQNEISYTFDKYFLPSGKHLQVQMSDTADIKFSPTERKTYIGRLIIRSDINTRDVANINNTAREKIFYIKARGIAPDIILNNNDIDFKNVKYSEDCPSIKDTNIIISNTGNQSLKISKIEIEPNNGIPFYFSNDEINIPPGSNYKFNLKLNTQNLPIGQEYNYKIKFTNNSLNNPIIELKLKLISSKLDVIKVQFPEIIKAKTGRIIEIPILTEKNKIINAKTFSSIISFNKDILEFESFKTIQTASEPAISAQVIDTGDTYLSISCNSEISNFFPSDTLIILRFRTFLADTYYSPLIFNSFKIGNNVCDNIYSININSVKSNFSIDSICGLDFKLLKKKNIPITNLIIFPNPTSDEINFNFNSIKDGVLKINVLTQNGTEIQEFPHIKYVTGDNKIKVRLNNLASGSYYLKISSQEYQELFKLNIIK